MLAASVAELDFWKGIVKHYDRDYLDFRRRDFEWYSSHFGPGISFAGRGLDLGSGCVSMLHWSSADEVIALDPLQNDFAGLVTAPTDHRVKYVQGDGEAIEFPDNYFDWVVCWNVIDHTPHPDRMAREIHRVTRGPLYLEVNFDEVLTPEHYGLWDRARVDEVLKGFHLVQSAMVPTPAMMRLSFFGTFVKMAVGK